MSDRRAVLVKVRPLASLFTGTRRPPSFHSGPTREYAPFFASIEATTIDCAALMVPNASDQELERVYRLLKRHPDGHDDSPLFSYARAAACLYLSFRDVSRDEFDATLARIALAVKRLSAGPGYFEVTAEMFLGEPAP